MVAVFCVGLGEFLTFAATVLAILVNMGQITQNTVARHIRYADLDTTGFESTLRANTNAGVAGVYAPDQAAQEAAGNGLKLRYEWGLYNYCGGSQDQGARSCVERSFGFRWQPVQAIYADLPVEYQATASQVIGANTFTDSEYLGRFTHAAFYLIFIGTIVTGVAFLVGFLAHRFAFFFAAILSLAGAALLLVGAALWTAVLYKARDAIANIAGLTLSAGNALWMTWAAGGAAFVATVPLIISCCTGRASKY